MPELSEGSEKLVASFGPDMRAKALAAIAEDKAFCPACNWAGMSNCGYFDECGSGIMPDGRSFEEHDAHKYLHAPLHDPDRSPPKPSDGR